LTSVARPRLPLLEALEERVRANPVRLCVPGHGGGAYAPAAFARALARHGPWALDWTEVPGLDDLAWPSGPIAEAEALLARHFGAEGAAILVGGSTAGILASVIAFAGRGPVALAPGSHRSVYGALALARVAPSFLPERVDARTGLSLGPDPGAAVGVFASDRPTMAVVTYPTYQGVAPPLETVAAAAHAVGALVVADSAHGAHFGLDPRLPPSALAAGADVAVFGLHKSLGALTQAAAVVWRAGVDGARLRGVLRVLQSASPSYLLMASIDGARAAAAAYGPRRWRRALDRAGEVRGWLGEEAWLPPVAHDPSRVVWLASHGGGPQLYAALRQQGVEPEYADARGVLLLIGPNLAARDLARLRKAFAAAAVRRLDSGPAQSPVTAPPAPLPPDMDMLAALVAPTATVPLAQAAGRCAADFLVPYPPGVPLVLPGRRLTTAEVRALEAALAQGREVQGVGPGATIRVVRWEGGWSA
jgi:arginine/lysine/ornithine decarboxylase